MPALAPITATGLSRSELVANGRDSQSSAFFRAPGIEELYSGLEERGWVKRRRLADDGRVVLVSLTDAGRATLEEFRDQLGAALRARMDAMPDEQIATLKTATENTRLTRARPPERGRDVG
jgi:hypothetical protein